ncbi:MAG: hypothetical protein JWM89_2231 [Acidimicrobiales bacterium]|nr:hypothetical protein [Acidimicrobiales bacterium]
MTTHEFSNLGRFAPGAIGEPGHRVFYLQAFADGTEVAVKCEKQQAQALADHLVKLLADLPGTDDPVPPAEALPPSDLSWAVGSISIGVDRADNRIVVLLEEFVDPEEPDPDPGRMRIHLTREQVRAYAGQVDILLATSRPLCRLCEQPIDPDGHACPRLN